MRWFVPLTLVGTVGTAHAWAPTFGFKAAFWGNVYNARSSSFSLRSSANDVEVQRLFDSACDADGLMQKSDIMKMEEIAALLDEEDLRWEEFDMFWDRAPKFPTDSSKIDVDSFTQIWRDIDDLFEFEDEVVPDPTKIPPTSSPTSSVTVTAIAGEDDDESGEELELETIFQGISNDSRLLSLDVLREWDEVKRLLDDGLLGEEELLKLWQDTTKSPGSPNEIDADGLATLEIDDVMRWSELKELVDEGSLEMAEVRSIFGECCSAAAGGAMDVSGFAKFDKMIEDLFEDEEGAEVQQQEPPLEAQGSALKSLLLEKIGALSAGDPLALNCEDEALEEVLEIVNELCETSTTNLVDINAKAVVPSDIEGDWELLYTNSGMFRFYQGLTGLAQSMPNGKFNKLTQSLKAKSYANDCVYEEIVDVVGGQEVIATVDGDWSMKSTPSLLTGEPTVLMSVEPGTVKYGPTSTKADHWKSVRCMNQLDMSFMDKEGLRIMRGNTSLDTIFIFKKIEK
ncbi:hypothetical protein TrRE_jg9747 [Triparma retinervis]|uniref:Plastid lipid-associated protein/fibrillin conserved domain-containing protein n=1 Tax=Triparma retinervis TaxID=2557542 RepID=A0A9W6ZFW6_9STRA|nr:hypothetical protein TrRE_jg9747 [Triparma retinervis]